MMVPPLAVSERESAISGADEVNRRRRWRRRRRRWWRRRRRRWWRRRLPQQRAHSESARAVRDAVAIAVVVLGIHFDDRRRKAVV